MTSSKMVKDNRFKGKVVTAREALSTIKNGSRIFIGSSCGEPQHHRLYMIQSQVFTVLSILP